MKEILDPLSGTNCGCFFLTPAACPLHHLPTILQLCSLQAIPHPDLNVPYLLLWLPTAPYYPFCKGVIWGLGCTFSSTCHFLFLPHCHSSIYLPTLPSCFLIPTSSFPAVSTFFLLLVSSLLQFLLGSKRISFLRNNSHPAKRPHNVKSPKPQRLFS